MALTGLELAIGLNGMGFGSETDPIDSTDLRDHFNRFSIEIFEMNESTRDRRLE